MGINPKDFEDFDELEEEVELSSLDEISQKVAQQKKTTVTEEAITLVYHLQYNAEGEIYDYHVDRWKMPDHIINSKLKKRDSEGRRIWVRRLPPNAKKAVGAFKCRDERCGLTFLTPLDLEQHMRSHHRTLWEVEKRKDEQAQKDGLNKLLETFVKSQEKDNKLREDILEQNRMLMRIIAEQSTEKKKGG